MTSPVDSLNVKQRTFAQEYLVDLNATQAAIRAGYSEKTANSQGSRLLANAKVKAAIDHLMAERSQRTQVTVDRVLEEIAKLAFANMMDYVTINGDGTAYVDLTQVTREQAAALGEVIVDQYTEGEDDDEREVKRVKIKLIDKTKNLELLGRHLKMFTDKLEVDAGDKTVAALRAGRQRVAEARRKLEEERKAQEEQEDE